MKQDNQPSDQLNTPVTIPHLSAITFQVKVRKVVGTYKYLSRKLIQGKLEKIIRKELWELGGFSEGSYLLGYSNSRVYPHSSIEDFTFDITVTCRSKTYQKLFDRLVSRLGIVLESEAHIGYNNRIFLQNLNEISKASY